MLVVISADALPGVGLVGQRLPWRPGRRKVRLPNHAHRQKRRAGAGRDYADRPGHTPKFVPAWPADHMDGEDVIPRRKVGRQLHRRYIVVPSVAFTGPADDRPSIDI